MVHVTLKARKILQHCISVAILANVCLFATLFVSQCGVFDDVVAGILKMYEDIMLRMDFIHLAQFLTRLPEHIQSDDLFQQIDRVRMLVDTRSFRDVLATHRDAVLRDNSTAGAGVS